MRGKVEFEVDNRREIVAGSRSLFGIRNLFRELVFSENLGIGYPIQLSETSRDKKKSGINFGVLVTRVNRVG